MGFISTMINVVHISKTPLVGAPGNISYYLNALDGFKSYHLYSNDYPDPLKGFFTKNSIKIDFDSSIKSEWTIRVLRNANIIHIHNDITDDIIDLLSDFSPNARYFYHVHSPLREPPLYVNVPDRLPFVFEKKLCVAQVYPRLYPNYFMVPNIIPHQGVREVIEHNEVFRILFSPTHNRVTNMRFGGKFSPAIKNILDSLSKKVEIIQPEKPIPPNELLSLRESTDITIDEIVTGGFHQVSYEGLACGNVVINNADELSKMNFAAAINSAELPPFVRCDDYSLEETILSLIQDRAMLFKTKRESLHYYNKYMQPQKLIGAFSKLYIE